MKTDIALHEIMRIDEQDDTQAEHSTIADPTQPDAERPTLGQPFMKSEESASTADDVTVAHVESPASASDVIVALEVPVASPVADPTVAEVSPASRPDDTTAAQPVMTLHTPPSDAVDDTTVAEISPASRPDDTTAAQPVMSLHDTTNLEISAAPVMSDTSAAIACDDSSTESPAEILRSIQTNTTGFFDEVVTTAVTFYKQNKPLLTVLGIALAAVLTIKLLFAGLNAIDDIPLVTPILKLIGLVYVVRFVWRYLLREQDRQELGAIVDRTKAEVFGTQD